jgi:hypothetical protein
MSHSKKVTHRFFTIRLERNNQNGKEQNFHPLRRPFFDDCHFFRLWIKSQK